MNTSDIPQLTRRQLDVASLLEELPARLSIPELCTRACITQLTFYSWLKNSPTFKRLYHEYLVESRNR